MPVQLQKLRNLDGSQHDLPDRITAFKLTETHLFVACANSICYMFVVNSVRGVGEAQINLKGKLCSEILVISAPGDLKIVFCTEGNSYLYCFGQGDANMDEVHLDAIKGPISGLMKADNDTVIAHRQNGTLSRLQPDKNLLIVERSLITGCNILLGFNQASKDYFGFHLESKTFVQFKLLPH